MDSLEEAKKKGSARLKVERDVASDLDALVAKANGGRASIGIKRLHVERAIRLVVADGKPMAYVFGAKSMSTRVAFVMVVRDKDHVGVIAADTRRVDGNKGPAAVFPSLAPWDPSSALEADIEGETAEKREAARAAGRGIELHALSQVTDPGLLERLKRTVARSGDNVLRFTLAEMEKHLGIEGAKG